jgi:thiamine pyrophosphate-dependent acetolactate synthase large subunit-like protein
VPDPGKKTIVQCTVDTLDINRSYETRHAVIGDAKLTRQALIDELSTRTGGGRKRPAVVEEIRAGEAPPWMRLRGRSPRANGGTPSPSGSAGPRFDA